MSAAENELGSAGFEPDPRQFDMERWELPDGATRADYAAAVEDLRIAVRGTGTRYIHARLVGQPTAAAVRSISQRLSDASNMERPETAPAVSERIAVIELGELPSVSVVVRAALTLLSPPRGIRVRCTCFPLCTRGQRGGERQIRVSLSSVWSESRVLRVACPLPRGCAVDIPGRRGGGLPPPPPFPEPATHQARDHSASWGWSLRWCLCRSSCSCLTDVLLLPVGVSRTADIQAR